jgi:L-arabinose isomerase
MRSVQYSRIGFLGHTYPGMLNMYSDFTMHHAQLGTHVEVLELDDLQTRVDKVKSGEIKNKIKEIK